MIRIEFVFFQLIIDSRHLQGNFDITHIQRAVSRSDGQDDEEQDLEPIVLQEICQTITWQKKTDEQKTIFK